MGGHNHPQMVGVWHWLSHKIKSYWHLRKDLFYLFRGYHTPYSYPIGKSSLSHPLYIYILNYIPPWNHHSPHEDTPRTGTSCWPREHHRLCARPFFKKLTIYVLVNRYPIIYRVSSKSFEVTILWLRNPAPIDGKHPNDGCVSTILLVQDFATIHSMIWQVWGWCDCFTN